MNQTFSLVNMNTLTKQFLKTICWILGTWMFLVLPVNGQANERTIEISERYYHDGRYWDAFDNIERGLRKMEKRDKGLIYAEMLMYRMKYLVALGWYDEFEAQVITGLALKKQAGENSMIYGKALLDVAYAYLLYSDVQTSLSYLEQAENVLNRKDLEFNVDKNIEVSRDSLIDYQINQKIAYIKTKSKILRGEYDEAKTMLPKLAELSLKTIEDKGVAYNGATNTFYNYNFDSYQSRRQKTAHAEVLTTVAETERRLGNYQVADSLFKSAEDWISKNGLGKNLAYIRNKHLQLVNMIDLGKDVSNAKKELEKLTFLAEKRIGLVHEDFLKLHETLIDYYIISRYARKSRTQRWELNMNTGLYYGEDRVQHAVAARLDAKKDFYARNLEDSYDRLMEIYEDKKKLPLNHLERVKVVEQLYRVSLALDSLDMAKKFLVEARNLQDKILGENAIDNHINGMRLADFYLTFTNQFDSTRHLLTESFDKNLKVRLNDTHKDYTYFLQEYAEYYEVTGKYDSALYIADQIVSINERKYGTNHLRYAIGLESVADLDIETGRFKEADTNINHMIEIFEKNSYKRRMYDEEYSHVLETAARYYALMGLFDEANDRLLKADRLSNRAPTAITNSSTADELAYLYIRTGRFRETERILEDAIAVRKERYGEENRFLITPYNQMARLLFIKGEYIEAEEMVEKALNLAIKTFGDRSLRTTESRTIKGDIYSALGDYDKAKEEVRNVISIEERLLGGNHVELANSYTQLALIKYYAGENIKEVEDLMNRAKEIIMANLGEDNPVYAGALKNLALVYNEGNKEAEAIAALSKADAIWVSKLGDNQNVNSAEIALLMGDIEVKRNRVDAAITQYSRARAIFQKKFGKTHPEYVKSISRLARAKYTKKEFTSARKLSEEVIGDYLSFIEKLFPSLSEREKAKYWQKIRGDFDFYANLAFTTKNKKMIEKVYNNVMNTKGLLLNSSIKIRNKIFSSGDSTLINSYNTWLDKKAQLTKTLAMSEEQRKAENLDAKAIEKEIEKIEKSLSKSSDFFSGQELPTWKELKKSLNNDEVAIELIRFNHFDKTFTDSVIYAAMIVTPRTSGAPEYVLLPNGKDLETKWVGYFRTCIQFEIPDKESYKNFWQPVVLKLEDILKKSAYTSKIYLSAEGVYNQINLESLPSDDGQYVIDLNNISLVSNTKELIDRGKKKSKDVGVEGEVVLMGNPIFYSDLKESEYTTYTNRPVTQLPGTMKEIEELNSLMSKEQGVISSSYTANKATEDMVRSLKSPKIFHIATHGFFLPDETVQEDEQIGLGQEKEIVNPLYRSGLLLKDAGELMTEESPYAFNRKDGVLTAFEAMSLNFDDTELVVLSACETGRGDNKVGDGVYGLQRAILVAGADALVMSLFEVSDEATQKLMLFFYRNWIEKKMNKRDAFIEAKKELRKEFPSPKYWGAFIMVGAA
jgi:CHAT domain-containing protein/lipopolysaccharide biosynthesis regulator YciM